MLEVTCLRCGIFRPRPTLRKRLRRYETKGIAGLKSRSHRPHRIRRKVSKKEVVAVLPMRKESKFGHRRMQSELYRLHDKRLSVATIYKLLTRLGLRQLSPNRFLAQAKEKNL